MNLFKKIAELGVSCKMSIVPNGEKEVTVLVSPANIKSNVQPLSVTATPEELDEKFLDVFETAFTKASGMISNIESFEKQLEDMEKKKKEEKDNKSKSSSKTKETTKVKPSSIKKDEEDEDEEDDERGTQEKLL